MILGFLEIGLSWQIVASLAADIARRVALSVSLDHQQVGRLALRQDVGGIARVPLPSWLKCPAR
jgi:hypothetical protein